MQITTQSTVGAFLDAVEDNWFDKDKLIDTMASWLGAMKLEEMIKHYDWFVPGINEPDLEDE